MELLVVAILDSNNYDTSNNYNIVFCNVNVIKTLTAFCEGRIIHFVILFLNFILKEKEK